MMNPHLDPFFVVVDPSTEDGRWTYARNEDGAFTDRLADAVKFFSAYDAEQWRACYSRAFGHCMVVTLAEAIAHRADRRVEVTAPQGDDYATLTLWDGDALRAEKLYHLGNRAEAFAAIAQAIEAFIVNGEV